MSPKILAALACAVLLAACSPPAAPPRAAEEAGIDTLQSPTAQGRELVCLLSYVAVRGPLVAESRARIEMVIENGVLGKGWSVEKVEVLDPLPNAEGFDPWLQFLPGVQRQFFSEEGALATLAMADGAPLTLNRATGDLNWSVEGPLGETEYTGACR